MELAVGLVCVTLIALTIVLVVKRQRPVCDVCGTKVASGATACPQCGADFTDPGREYHSPT
jgi:tRNA(Ile2) C34 agmatinyltransferase TiaS